MQIDAEFRELFDELSSETVINEYIDFDIEVVYILTSNWSADSRMETKK